MHAIYVGNESDYPGCLQGDCGNLHGHFFRQWASRPSRRLEQLHTHLAWVHSVDLFQDVLYRSLRILSFVSNSARWVQDLSREPLPDKFVIEVNLETCKLVEKRATTALEVLKRDAGRAGQELELHQVNPIVGYWTVDG